MNLKTAIWLALAALPLSAHAGTRLWITGTSNLHDWKCEAQTVNTRLEVEGKLPTGLLPRAVDVTIPVEALRCGESKMDEKLQEALKMKAHPEIHFLLASAKALPDGKRVLVEGRLTIAGVERKVALIATLAPSEAGVTVTASLPVEMTDYGVEPPTALFGMLKTGDQVVVHFSLVLAPGPGGVTLTALAARR